MPLIRSLEPLYTADGWSTDIQAVIDRLVAKFTGGVFNAQANRVAQQTVSRADSINDRQFLESVNRAVGIDFFNPINTPGIDNYLESSVLDNTNLIKSISSQYLERVQDIVMNGTRAGSTPGVIAKSLSKQFGINQRRAKNIARDQVAKLNGDLTAKRQQNAGIEYFQWVTSEDSRVGADHDLASDRQTKYGKGVYRWDDPPPEGIPGHSTRPNCRCTARPIFKWQLKKS